MKMVRTNKSRKIYSNTVFVANLSKITKISPAQINSAKLNDKNKRYCQLMSQSSSHYLLRYHLSHLNSPLKG